MQTIKVDCTCVRLCRQTDHLLITEMTLFVFNWICLTTFWVLLILPQALNDDKVPLNKAHIVTIATLTGHAVIAMGPAYSVCHKTFCLLFIFVYCKHFWSVKYNIMSDLPYVKLKVWVLVLPRMKSGRTGRYIQRVFFGGLKFTGLIELVREKSQN